MSDIHLDAAQRLYTNASAGKGTWADFDLYSQHHYPDCGGRECWPSFYARQAR